jgi:hypothetical protein
MSAQLATARKIRPLGPEDPHLVRRLDRLIARAGVGPADAVALAGPRAGEAMGHFCRLGFARVEAARRLTCPAADQTSDLLLVIGCRDPGAAIETLGALLPIVREGGRVGVDGAGLASVRDRRRILAFLESCGLRPEPGEDLLHQILAWRGAQGADDGAR